MEKRAVKAVAEVRHIASNNNKLPVWELVVYIH
ncbi:hypothetical protein PVOR_30939 [Paenibacillus vortex V453]|uniref:Uncharacterized protein n=1 Tax=Paenibacillus vortex V453 TaxID=715225 RepID=A0A2R9SLH3_9BACL|nr:hypothetical protein PVOR_30939 [Paenibacillus vortex V453]